MLIAAAGLAAAVAAVLFAALGGFAVAVADLGKDGDHDASMLDSIRSASSLKFLATNARFSE